ncbi:transcription termination/antitermination protein NusA [candidate division WWE3 bacterium CG_4_8_14_3_um_filter_42_11]|uniref:Transcription termination/antitermination protein NusA n=2 Tax=Katanobacteria TaxID=422282 RepID=A0A2M7TBV0_UNCKA|nr:MAG: transcription termination/antitermination protein NusA [candidate division WWE3 bacterium CG_4_10_14_0_2_um_filter_42_8]PJC69306.1 MAG: transcription termination/antitermination protein NusA [candidate division WWE3 bacterium CG_4_8_14_3_um_filter_42_11]
MIRTEFAAAINQICSERGITPEVVLETIKTALLAAYRKDYGAVAEDLEVQLDRETGEAKILQEGKDVTPVGFGRIAAQTAKQVILQKIREAEKEAILDDFKNKVGNLVSGMVQRFEDKNVILDIGRTTGVMPPQEQVGGEYYRLNQRLKVLIKEIKKTNRGYEIILSRADRELVKRLFEIEVPEVHSGAVEIKVISREPGSRSKIAVFSNREGVDPIGSCVGQKGVRVQAVTQELFNEKIDIVSYSDDPQKFIAASLSPARVVEIKIKRSNKEAKVFVNEDQLSLAIGKEGQNVRLAARLTGWKIDIKGYKEKKESKETKKGEETETQTKKLEVAGISKRVVTLLNKEGIKSLKDLKQKKESLQMIKGLGKKSLEEITKALGS